MLVETIALYNSIVIGGGLIKQGFDCPIVRYVAFGLDQDNATDLLLVPAREAFLAELGRKQRENLGLQLSRIFY